MKVRWLSHSGFVFQGAETVVVDPFLTGNPESPIGPEEIDGADAILVTHAHDDHLGDAHAISRRTEAPIVASHEISLRAADDGCPDPVGMNIGGTCDVGDVRVHMVQAFHTCELADATGFIFELDGTTVYHTGDTGLFSDMGLFAEFFDVDVLCLPIGDHYTMGPPSAAKAVELVEPATVVPMHYGTFDLIEQDPQEFAEMVGDGAEVVILEPGETREI